MRKIIPIVLVIALIFSTPFIFTITFNEIKLITFSRQLERVELFIDSNSMLIASGRMIYVGGKDESCTYSATRVYKYFSTKTDDIATSLERLRFNTVHTNSAVHDIESYFLVTDSRIVITIEDGPYPAGFDFRCW